MNTNGYRPSHRNKWLFLREQVLSAQALLLWDYYIDQMDFDPKHGTYGTFAWNIAEIKSIFHCSENTVRNWHKELVDKKLVFRCFEKGRFRLLQPERYIQRSSISTGGASNYARAEKDQPVELLLQSLADSAQHIGQTPSPSQISTSPKALSSFKVDYSSTPVHSPINKDGGFSGFESQRSKQFAEQDGSTINELMEALINPEKK